MTRAKRSASTSPHSSRVGSRPRCERGPRDARERYVRAEVREEERDAQKLGIRGVPFFVIGDKYAVSGAQPAEVLLGAIEKAWAERNPR